MKKTKKGHNLKKYKENTTIKKRNNLAFIIKLKNIKP